MFLAENNSITSQKHISFSGHALSWYAPFPGSVIRLRPPVYPSESLEEHHKTASSHVVESELCHVLPPGSQSLRAELELTSQIQAACPMANAAILPFYGHNPRTEYCDTGSHCGQHVPVF